MSAFYDLASLVLVPSGYKASKVYAQKPLTTDGQLTFSRASTATRVNASGALETVSSNVPRLDYTDSTCPKLLLEPQRTQKLTGSNTFTNVYWTLASQGLGSAPVITANYGTDPFGGNNASRIQLNLNGGTDASSRSWILQNFNPSATVTLSMYIKLNSAGSKTVVLSDSGGSTVTVNSTSWTRISQVQSGGAGEFRFGLIGGSTSDTLDASICYAQCEEGSYPTSVIVSTTAAVTRLADECSKTGISSLIGQTEGTLFAEFVPNGDFQHRFSISQAGSSNNWIFFSMPEASNGNGRVYIRTNSTTWVDTGAGLLGAFVSGQRYKVAFAYKSGSWAIYVNGVLKSSGSQTFTAPSIPIDGFYPTGTGGTIAVQAQLTITGLNQALLFKTRLPNAQLAELTSL